MAGGTTMVFVSLYGQQDNLGDSILRREMLRAIRGDGRVLHVHVGDNSQDFTSGLDLTSGDRLYASRRAWNAALVRETARRRSAFVFSPGEASSAPYVTRGTELLVRGVRASGGQVIHAGIGLRSPSEVHLPSVRRVAEISTYLSWRDPDSRDAVGAGDVVPDWAFGAAPWLPDAPPPSERKGLSIAMRGDRPEPDEAWYRQVRGLISSFGLEPKVVVQVRRDEDRGRQIARELGAEVHAWPPGAGHLEWEREVRAQYSTSRAVLSDRLHALVVGATEGAVPLGFPTGSAEKLVRTLAPAGLSQNCATPREAPAAVEARLGEAVEAADGVADVCAAARRKVLDSASAIRARL